MKTKSLLLISCCFAFAASCTEVSEQSGSTTAVQNPIGFLSNTTRADVLTIDDLKGDKDGFIVYGMMADGDTWDTEMNSSNSYTFATGEWAWSGATPEWPDESGDSYPINFYAYYYDTSAAGITITDDSEELLAVNYIAPTDGQTDILVASATADVRPTGDKLPLIFNHILSKVNFSIKVGEGTKVHTQAVGFNQICDNRDYNISDELWSDNLDTGSDDYPYLLTANTAIDSSVADIEGSYGNLMLLPQTTTSWDPEDDAAVVEGAHIYLIYRAEMGSDVNAVGYENAANHPNYNAEEYSKYAGSPLFVKVGYPLGDEDFVIEAGMSYDYEINLGVSGATNGYLIDEYYYDENGDVTEFLVEGRDLNDPISNGYINFTVSVAEWVEQDDATAIL